MAIAIAKHLYLALKKFIFTFKRKRIT